MIKALSSLNFRDLGGLPAADGRRLRYDMIYRSEGPGSFSAEHRRELRALDIRFICDLRSEVERRTAPNDWNETGRLLHFDVTSDLRTATNQGWSSLRNDPSEDGAKTAMKANYMAIPTALHPRIVPLIDAIIDRETPVLIHCTAGKDRTGVLVALLLALLEVPYEDIVCDYLRSDVFAKNLRLAGSIADAFNETLGFRPSAATINAMIGVDTEFLDAAFTTVVRDWGSIGAYFASAGSDRGRCERFRDVLLEDGGT